MTSILKITNGFGVSNDAVLGKGGKIMRIQAESWAVYRKAYNAGKKNARKMTKQGTDPYLPVLADILSEDMISEKVTIGTMGIPTDRICGLATDADKERYTHDFLPLPSPDSDFATKWCKIYWHYLGNKGGCCPITCYEYLGVFYIIDGAKRVSIARCHGIPTITASVIRLMPVKSGDPVIQQYYDFVSCFEKTGLYQVAFSRPYSLPRFQQAFGFEPDHVWNDSDRLDFLFNWHIFELAFQEAYNGYLNITPADAFLVLLEKHPYEKLREMPPIILIQLMRNVWDKLYAIQNAASK